MGLSKKKVEQETNLAALVDQALLFTNASDSPATGRCPVTLATNDMLTLQCPTLGFSEFSDLYEFLGYGWKAGCLYASRKQGYRVSLAEVEDLPASERARLKAWNVIRSQLTRVTRCRYVDIAADGRTAERVTLFETNWEDPENPFMPLGSSGTRTGQRRRRYSRSGWVETVDIDCGEETLFPMIAARIAVGLRSSWLVRLGQEGLTPITLMTDAVGVKSLFRLRDVPDGMTRRAALLHWVTEHLRRIRRDPDVEIEVRGHLRGRETFDWFGMRGEVRVPELDEAAVALPAAEQTPTETHAKE
jgi:hypothetical protein